MNNINHQMAQRRFGRFNTLGVKTLCIREVKRFLNVYTQTLVAPVATSGLFLLVFSLAFAARRGNVGDIPYTAFLAPGIVMMAVIQQSFANTSSSLILAKVQGNIVDTLMPPLSPIELTVGIASGGTVRGVLVMVLSCVVLFPFADVGVTHIGWAVFFTVAGAALLALLGMVSGIWAEKYDHTSAVTNFIVVPLSFLSGTFYSISVLPDTWQQISRANPFFYLIDGFRYAIIGTSDADPKVGALVILAAIIIVGAIVWRMFKTGYGLKS